MNKMDVLIIHLGYPNFSFCDRLVVGTMLHPNMVVPITYS